MPTIRANGIDLYYEQHGWDKAGDVLVLSNGILMSTASWAYQTPVLSQYVRLLLYDCRGMWQSEHPPGPYSLAQHADDLAALLDGLGVAQAHIGGISYGVEISAREIPHSEFAVIPDAGHAVIWEQAGVFNSLILGFLAKQET